MSNAEPFAWLVECLRALSRHRLWRSTDHWRRRDSVLLVGLLGWIEFPFITVILVGNLSLVSDLGVGFLAAPLGALVLAEAAVAIRPTQRRLARADQLVLVTVGTFLALGLLGVIASAI